MQEFVSENPLPVWIAVSVVLYLFTRWKLSWRKWLLDLAIWSPFILIAVLFFIGEYTLEDMKTTSRLVLGWANLVCVLTVAGRFFAWISGKEGRASAQNEKAVGGDIDDTQHNQRQKTWGESYHNQ